MREQSECGMRGVEGHTLPWDGVIRSTWESKVNVEWEEWNKLSGSVWTWRGGGCSVVCGPTMDIPRGSETSERNRIKELNIRFDKDISGVLTN